MSTTETPTATPERMEFKTEVKQLLNLVVHSLYTKPEIFLRELISNAADAIDKLRFESLKNPELLSGEGSDWKIRLVPDESHNFFIGRGPDIVVAGIVHGGAFTELGRVDGRYLSTEVAGGMTGRMVGVVCRDGAVVVRSFNYAGADDVVALQLTNE